MTLIVLTIAGLVLARTVDPGFVANSDGYVTQVMLCDDGACDTTVTLPLYRSADPDLPLTEVMLRVDVDTAEFATGLPAILIPRTADRIDVAVNGTPVSPDTQRQWRNWNQPVYATVPRTVLTGDTTRIDLHLTAQPGTRIALDPFQIGEAESLFFTHQAYVLGRIGYARITLGGMIVGAVMFPLAWLARRRNYTYLWLGATCLCALPAATHWVLRVDPMAPDRWAIIWSAGLGAAGYCAYRFVAALQNQPVRWVSLLYLSALTGVTVAAAALPAAQSVDAVRLLQAMALAIGTYALSLLLDTGADRSRLHSLPIFALMSVTLASGFLVWLYYGVTPPPIQVTGLPIGGVAALCAMMWLVFAELFTTLRGYETITGVLRSRVEERTEQLRRTYAQLAESDRRRTLEEERQRIMLDLHDGVGGQLANTLAYMSNTADQDPVLRDALEDALRDLAMTIDSLETTESVATLLGTLRARLEPLLEERGLRFSWQVEDEPPHGLGGPSQNLMLLRIVQEAITNAVKHSGARTVVVRLTRDRLCIADDGHGFSLDAEPERRGLNGGYGLVGMKRRAQQLGAELEIDSGPDGTTIQLIWPQTPPQNIDAGKDADRKRD